MPSKSKSRSFPKDKNLLLKPNESRTPLNNSPNSLLDHALVKKCKSQDVIFDTFTIPIIRLRIPVPESPASQIIGSEKKLLTRMRDTDYFLTNSMFEAAYPFASDSEKAAEKTYIEKTYSTVTDEKNVRGVWVTSDVALQIAKEYDITPYIEALMAAAPDRPSDSLIGTKGSELVGATLVPQVEEPRRSRRSVSPKKAATKARAPSSTGRGRKKKGSVKDDESVASSVKNSPVVPHAVVTKAEKAIEEIVEEAHPVLDTIKVGVRPPNCLFRANG
jgi:hypothetical protein